MEKPCMIFSFLSWPSDSLGGSVRPSVGRSVRRSVRRSVSACFSRRFNGLDNIKHHFWEKPRTIISFDASSQTISGCVCQSVYPSVRQPCMCESVQFVCIYVHRVSVCGYDGGVCVPLSVGTSVCVCVCVCARASACIRVCVCVCVWARPSSGSDLECWRVTRSEWDWKRKRIKNDWFVGKLNGYEMKMVRCVGWEVNFIDEGWNITLIVRHEETSTWRKNEKEGTQDGKK